VTVVVFALLIFVSGSRPLRSTMSEFELTRRANVGDETARTILRREQLLGDILSLQRIVAAVLLVIVVLLCVATFGWLLGIIIAVIIALEYGAIAQIAALQQQSQKLYERIEPSLLNFVERYGSIFVFFRSVPLEVDNSWQLESREELQHLVSQSGTVLTSDEKKLIAHSLSFGKTLVGSIMTPKTMIDSIKKSDVLGPLVLDDLHKTGHSRFPVTDGDIDHIIGIVHIQSLLALDTKRSITAEKAMEPQVFYIKEDQTLQHALAAFLRTHHHLFIVVNEFRETVGLLSLEDVLEALLGRPIIDEFDTHDNLRVVAARNPRDNNHPEKREDV